MWNEFKTFAFKGNAFDLAVGVMVGAGASRELRAPVTIAADGRRSRQARLGVREQACGFGVARHRREHATSVPEASLDRAPVLLDPIRLW